MRFLTAFLCTITLLTAQTGWQVQSPYPTNAALSAAWSFNATTMIAVGSYAIVKTTDGGTTWKNIPTSNQYNFDVSFADASVGYVSGSEIMRTTDGGDSWTKVSPPITNVFYMNVKAFGTDTVYAGCGGSVSYGLYFLKSFNGGKDWIIDTLTKSSTMGKMFAVNKNVIWMSNYQNGGVWKSTDAGNTWAMTATGAGNTIADMAFRDTSNGLLTSELGLYGTTDGGATWAKKSAVTTASSGRVFYLSATTALIRASSLLKSTDGGANWTTSGTLPAGTTNISFLTATAGWAVGSSGLLSYTTDGGTQWSNKNQSAFISTPVDVQFFNADTGWVITLTEFLKTTNGGKVWTKLVTNSGYSNRAFHFVDSQNGWIVGNPQGGAYAAMKTTDGGNTWNSVPYGMNKVPADVHFADVNNGMIAQDSGYVLRTTDAGANWTKTRANTTRGIYHVWMMSATTALCLDDKGGVYKTTDGGTNWVTKVAPGPSSMSSLKMLNSTYGWLSMSYSEARRTTDGGETWKAFSIGIENLRDIQFVTPAIGFACSQNSWFYVTTDSGATWTKNAGPTSIVSLHFVSPYVGYAVGTGIMKTTTAGGVLAVNDRDAVSAPAQFRLDQNFPNPFNPTTTIAFTLPVATTVRLEVFDAIGRSVSVLVNEWRKEGNHHVSFNGAGLASGMYLYRISGRDIRQTKRMLLMK